MKLSSAWVSSCPALALDSCLPYLTMSTAPARGAGHSGLSLLRHGVDYLLTWNCHHLANANKFEHIRVVNRRLGLMTPELVTPEQLFEETQS
jgi:hypothetical protein